MRKKMRYLPGFADLICFKIFNVGSLRVDIKDKNQPWRWPYDQVRKISSIRIYTFAHNMGPKWS